MGGSGRWLKSLISPAKSRINDQEKVRDKSKKKWRLWKSSAEGFGPSMRNMKKGHGATSEKSESSFVLDEKFTAVMATVVRASPKDFMVIKQEWAAIRIQAAFRGFLARRALRALRAVVRLQAIFRGRQVRKQAAVTLKCMQALVRVQARVRERNVKMSAEERAVQKFLEDRRKEADPVKKAEQGWCDSPGTVDEVKAKLQMRQEAALKRERAMAYSLFHQVLEVKMPAIVPPQRSNNVNGNGQHAGLGASPKLRATRPMSPLKTDSLDNKSSEYSFLDRWMAAKPWDSRLVEDTCSEPPNMTPISKKREDIVPPFHSYQERGSVRTRKTSVSRVTTGSSTKSLITSQSTPSSSTVSSEFMYGDSPISTSRTSKAKRGKESYFNKLYEFDRAI